MDASIIPQEWKKFLSIIQTMFPSAIIAGGALRDTICDNEVKDVDIFIADLDPSWVLDPTAIASLLQVQIAIGDETPIRDHVKLMHNIKSEKILAKGKYDKIDPRYVNQEGLGKRSLLESFINYIVDIQYNGVQYQLIFTEQEPVSMVYNDFDFGICKVYFDGLDLVITEEFWYDMENKQLTITGKFGAGQMLHTLFTHRKNLIKKFPNWKVVIEDLEQRGNEDMPPSFQAMMKKKPELQESPLTITYVYTGPDGVERTRTKPIGTSVQAPPAAANYFKKPSVNVIGVDDTPDYDAEAAQEILNKIKTRAATQSYIYGGATTSANPSTTQKPLTLADLDAMTKVMQTVPMSKSFLGSVFGIDPKTIFNQDIKNSQ